MARNGANFETIEDYVFRCKSVKIREQIQSLFSFSERVQRVVPCENAREKRREEWSKGKMGRTRIPRAARKQGLSKRYTESRSDHGRRIRFGRKAWNSTRQEPVFPRAPWLARRSKWKRKVDVWRRRTERRDEAVARFYGDRDSSDKSASLVVGVIAIVRADERTNRFD